MRLATFTQAGRRSWGAVVEDGIIDLGRVMDLTDIHTLLAADRLSDAAAIAAGRAPDYDRASVTLLKPLRRPGKCLCLSANYPDAGAGGAGPLAPAHPSLFARFPESFVGPDAPILRPGESAKLDYEGEVVVVIGRAGRRIPEDEAMEHVAGYMLANDGTLRDWVREESLDVMPGKNFFHSGSLGPWIVTRDAAGDGPFVLTTRVNGEVRQQDSTARLVFPIPVLIAQISRFMALAPGDIILTGTPAGIGARFDPPRYLAPGDVVEVAAEGLGVLRNTVADEEEE